MVDERASLLRQVSFCRELPAATLAALAAAAQPRRCPAGTVVQLEGEPAEAMYIVAAGRVKLTRISPAGREQIINVMGPGQHFNTVPIFDHGPCPVNAEAITEADLLVLPLATLRALTVEHAPLALALLREFSGRLRHMVDLIDSIALHTVQGRLARMLLSRAEAAEAGQLLAPLTQAEMAAHLGTVREMVGRTLHQFEAQGLIGLDRGTIVIRDRAGLAAQADG